MQPDLKLLTSSSIKILYYIYVDVNALISVIH